MRIFNPSPATASPSLSGLAALMMRRSTLKPIPPPSAAFPKTMRFFIFQYLSGIGAFTSCGILNGKILRKENAASHKRDSNPTFISPCGYMHRNNSTPRFSRAESAGGRLPIVNQAVHHCACFFDHMIPFFTVF